MTLNPGADQSLESLSLRREGAPDPSEGMARGPTQIEVFRPTDGSRLGRVPIQSGPEVRAVVDGVRRIQKGWGTLAPVDRARRMEGLLSVLRDRSEEIAEVVEAETGKPRMEALSEVVVCIDLLRYYRKHATRILRSERISSGWMLTKSARLQYEPYGVVGVIAPWNYPFILAMNPVATALFAGNGVVLKPSEFTPFTGLLVAELCRESGLPEGLVDVVTGDGPTGAALVEGGVDKVHFTGSPATGRRVMSVAARTLTPVTMELGGKDPAIVLEDADLERAARGIVFGAFYNAGQTCISTERVFVVETVYEPFVRRVAELTRQLRAGIGPDRDVGPMVHPGQAALVEDHIRDAIARGAKVIIGGERADSTSGVVEPTVLVDLTPGMRVMEEETFGPVLPIVRVRDEQEAIDLANDTSYGLYASVWTRRRDRGARVAGRLRAGGVSINDTLSHYGLPGLPMGGVGDSGFGRTGGVEGLREMARSRSLFTDRLGLKREIWWYPYSAFGEKVIRSLIQFRGRPGPSGVWEAIKTFFDKDGDRAPGPGRGASGPAPDPGSSQGSTPGSGGGPGGGAPAGPEADSGQGRLL